ncbi:MAG: ABC transporter ATP-binding protein, partial [Phycisphaerae bacterium]|nr:ABC transporter ATP-binding protein [Phycisphaerae bacterium]
HQLAILDLFKELNVNHGRTIVAVFHDLSLAGEYCERLLLLDEGKLVASGKTEEVLTQETLEKVYRTRVLVQPNPISGRPHVVLASGRHSLDAGAR